MFFGSTVKDSPAVEFTMFHLAHNFEVFAAVVECVIVLVVDFLSWWAVDDQPVHADRVGFPINDLPGHYVCRARRFKREPFERIEEIVISRRNDTKQAAPYP